MLYPQVHDEFETVKMLHMGYSIARFGDGEFKIMDGAGYVREPPNKALAHEMRCVLRSPYSKCLVAVPTMNPEGPKYASWARHKLRFAKMLRRTKVPLYSAFISRPDSAPWIATPEFVHAYASVWAGKKVVVLAEECSKTPTAARMPGADVIHIECPSHEAYKRIDEFEKALLASGADIALLSCGPTATCLANRLARRGLQAIDFGSGGKFVCENLK